MSEAVPRSAVDTYRAAEAGIADPVLRTKLYEVPRAIAGWLEPFGGFEGRRVLDFGCGFGETAAGTALGHGAAEVHGVDIQSKAEQCAVILRDAVGLDGLPDNLRFSQITPGETLGEGAYDVVVSWSVIEHVARAGLDAVLAGLHAALKPGGLAFIQISPLYFSPEGSHLWSLGYRAWEHLTHQTSEVLDAIQASPDLEVERKARVTRMYLTLNRLTATELADRLTATGFSLVREQRDRTPLEPPAALAAAYTREALTTTQIVLLLRRD